MLLRVLKKEREGERKAGICRPPLLKLVQKKILLPLFLAFRTRFSLLFLSSSPFSSFSSCSIPSPSFQNSPACVTKEMEKVGPKSGRSCRKKEVEEREGRGKEGKERLRKVPQTHHQKGGAAPLGKRKDFSSLSPRQLFFGGGRGRLKCR